MKYILKAIYGRMKYVIVCFAEGSSQSCLFLVIYQLDYYFVILFRKLQ